MIERHIALRTVARPRVLDDTRARSARDLDSAIRGAAVHHHDLVAERDRLECARQTLLLVAHDEAGCNGLGQRGCSMTAGSGRIGTFPLTSGQIRPLMA